ncbi:MAG: hypothetical protein ACYCP0_10030 [Acidiferrobacteraceae bacterium]
MPRLSAVGISGIYAGEEVNKALLKIDPGTLLAELRRTPTGAYTRRLLWFCSLNLVTRRRLRACRMSARRARSCKPGASFLAKVA